jgi:hypothetical protein
MKAHAARAGGPTFRSRRPPMEWQQYDECMSEIELGPGLLAAFAVGLACWAGIFWLIFG